MESSKAAWIYPVLALIALIATIGVGISQCKSNENAAIFNGNAIAGSVERQ